MAPNAETAAILLRQAAQYLRDVGSRHPSMAAKLVTNAATFDRVADLVEKDPHGGDRVAANDTD